MSMTLFALVQDLLLALALAFSLLMAWRKLLPGSSRRILSALARRLGRPGRGTLRRRLGRWLQPAEASRGACGDGGGCSSCSGCAPAVAPNLGDPHVLPLQIRPRSR